MQSIFSETVSQFAAGAAHKASLGDRGIVAQAERNERFYVGDQWHGEGDGSHPLVRRNIIRRIGEWKISTLAAEPVSVAFSPEREEDAAAAKALEARWQNALERFRFEQKREELLRRAYIDGTGIAYLRGAGDAVDMEVIGVGRAVFGDPFCSEVQRQPYIIVSSREDAEALRREALLHGVTAREAGEIRPDRALNDGRVTVYTKFWRDAATGRVKTLRATDSAPVRAPRDTGLRRYPFAVFFWTPRFDSAYGESDVTYQIPNQIAINRALSAEIWAITLTGVPTLLVNGNTVPDEVTNSPGQVVRVYADEIDGAMKFVSPPAFGEQMSGVVRDLAESTLTDNGANDAALGNVDPSNATAIIEAKEASLEPMRLCRERYYSFVEDLARVWCDLPGVMPGGGRFTPKIEVGEAFSTAATLSTLQNLYSGGVISKSQYLERIPDGVLARKGELVAAAKAEEEAARAEEEAVKAEEKTARAGEKAAKAGKETARAGERAAGTAAEPADTAKGGKRK